MECALQRGGIDHEAVAHIGGEYALVGLVDLVGWDDFIQVALSAIMDSSRAIEPDLYRRYLVLFLDGIQAAQSKRTKLPVGALTAHQTHRAMTRARRTD